MTDETDARHAAEALSRRQLLTRGGMAAGMFALPGLLAACGGGGGGGSSSGSPISKKTTDAAIAELKWALPGATRSLDFVRSYDSVTTSVLALALQGLLVYDDAGKLQPSLAESWDQPDPLTYVYTLRADATFSDGSPVTAKDVAYSMGQHLDPKSGSQVSTFYASVKTIEATGDHEVTVKMKQADPAFQYVPAAHSGFIVPEGYTSKQGRKIGTPGALPIGSGPFKITEYEPDRGVTLVRNDAYWGEKPVVERLRIDFITDSNTRQLALRSKDIAGAFGVGPEESRQWDRIDGAGVEFASELSVYFLSFDLSKPPWNDIHLRKAFAHAIDRDGLVQGLLKGRAEPATSLVPPGQWGNLLSKDEIDSLYASLPQYEYDLDKAKAELAQSSQPNGMDVTITYMDARPLMGKVLLALAKSLEQIGINLKVDEVTSDRWLNTLFEHKDLGLQSVVFVPDYPDPVNYPGVLLDAQHAVKNDFNMANYKDPAVAKLLADQAKEVDPKKRADLLGQALKKAAEDLPYLPILWPQVGMALSDEFAYPSFTSLYFNQPWATKVRRAA
jgi:peptide/nickel transport system substrate-binding protein